MANVPKDIQAPDYQAPIDADSPRHFSLFWITWIASIIRAINFLLDAVNGLLGDTFTLGGNSFGQDAVFGTNDDFPIHFKVNGQVIAILRNITAPPFPEPAHDLRLLASAGVPAIYTLVAANGTDYADYTYNGATADFDVSAGDFNIRPLQAGKNVNVWSIANNAKLRVGSAAFAKSMDIWHDGTDAQISANGKIRISNTVAVNGLGFALDAPISTDGGVDQAAARFYPITKGSAAALTLAAPAVGNNGIVIGLVSTTAFAHTLTATGLLQTGAASVNVATFAAFPGATLWLQALNGKWLVISQNAITFS